MIPADWSALPETADDPRDLEAADGARALTLDEVLPVLASPDDGSGLILQDDRLVSANGHAFPMVDGRPVLLPQKALAWLKDGEIQVRAEEAGAAFEQYLYLNQIKNAGGEPNSPSDDPWFHKHIGRSRRLFRGARGLVLDVGCDNPELSRSLFPQGVSYLGLEPAMGRAPGMRLVGMAEFLPLKDASVDGVAFMTSLDHILDYHSAIDEAYRALKPGGDLYVASLIWTQHAALFRDNIHFHHFRQFEIEGVLRRFNIQTVTRYDWKHDKHRFGVYLHARKPS